MILGVYGLFDKARNKFLSITVDVNDFVAKRSFLYAVSQSGELMYIAKDLELFKIAEIDIETGIINPLVVHQLVSNGAEYENK